MSSHLPDRLSHTETPGARMAIGLSLAALLTVVLAPGPVLLWLGLAVSCAASALSPVGQSRPRAEALLRSAALILVAAGLFLVSQGRETAVIPLIAGVGALAGWLPFNWSLAINAVDRATPLVAQLRPLIGVTTALVAAARLIPSGFALNFSVAFPVLFFAAALSLIVSLARLLTSRRTDDALFTLSAMAACGIAADVALRAGTTTLPVEILRGDVWGLATWLHGAVVWLLLTLASQPSASESHPLMRWRPLLATLLAADLAGIPPFPGFWIRGQLLLTMTSRQSASSITGEFEPHAGMLALSALFAVTWGALMATATWRIMTNQSPRTASGGPSANPSTPT